MLPDGPDVKRPRPRLNAPVQKWMNGMPNVGAVTATKCRCRCGSNLHCLLVTWPDFGDWRVRPAMPKRVPQSAVRHSEQVSTRRGRARSDWTLDATDATQRTKGRQTIDVEPLVSMAHCYCNRSATVLATVSADSTAPASICCAALAPERSRSKRATRTNLGQKADCSHVFTTSTQPH